MTCEYFYTMLKDTILSFKIIIEWRNQSENNIHCIYYFNLFLFFIYLMRIADNHWLQAVFLKNILIIYCYKIGSVFNREKG